MHWIGKNGKRISLFQKPIVINEMRHKASVAIDHETPFHLGRNNVSKFSPISKDIICRWNSLYATSCSFNVIATTLNGATYLRLRVHAYGASDSLKGKDIRFDDAPNNIVSYKSDGLLAINEKFLLGIVVI